MGNPSSVLGKLECLDFSNFISLIELVGLLLLERKFT